MKKVTLCFILMVLLTNCNANAQVKNAQTVENKKKAQTRGTQNNVFREPPTNEIADVFYQAIFDKDDKKVTEMLQTTFPPNYEPKNKISPLQAVIWTSDNVNLVKLLVEGGADFNKKDNPAILVASEYGRLEIMRYLIEQGADIKNNNAFDKAGSYQFYDGAKLLLLKGANQGQGDAQGKLWVFEQAVRKSDYEVLDKLHLTTDDINYNNCEGETALIIAIKKNNADMVKYLLKRGADKNKPETFDCGDDIYYGKKPLQIAKQRNLHEIVSLIK